MESLINNFPVRLDIKYGDSVVVIKGNEKYTGIFNWYAKERVVDWSCLDRMYSRYKTIYLISNNKRITIGRMMAFHPLNDLEVYYSRMVLTEKHTNKIRYLEF